MMNIEPSLIELKLIRNECRIERILISSNNENYCKIVKVLKISKPVNNNIFNLIFIIIYNSYIYNIIYYYLLLKLAHNLWAKLFITLQSGHRISTKHKASSNIEDRLLSINS